MEDRELKKRLKKIPDADKNGDPIYKIDAPAKTPAKKSGKNEKKTKCLLETPRKNYERKIPIRKIRD